MRIVERVQLATVSRRWTAVTECTSQTGTVYIFDGKKIVTTTDMTPRAGEVLGIQANATV